MTKFEEEPVATVEVIPTFDGNEINFKPSSKLGSYLIAEGEVELYLKPPQQALPVVPDCVAEGIESIPRHYSAFGAISLIRDKIKTFPEGNEDWLPIYNWLVDDIENQDIFALAFITGKYEVEKEKLFYLKNKLTTSYLALENKTGYYCHVSSNTKSSYWKTSFTQQEIDSMETGSYEQIEVEE